MSNEALRISKKTKIGQKPSVQGRARPETQTLRWPLGALLGRKRIGLSPVWGLSGAVLRFGRGAE